MQTGGDTAWLMTATALVLFMTLPGLALFYGGLVRGKNALSILIQCFAITGLVSVLWVLCGYGLAFGDGARAQPLIGSLTRSLLGGLTRNGMSGTVPEAAFVMFQMTFAIITPALVIGGFAERMRFSAVLWFAGLWLLLVYVPVTHWVWGGLARALGRDGFRGRYSRARQRGGRRTGGRAGDRSTARIPAGLDAASQPATDGGGRRHAVGRMVRI
jgi:ammonia channel protein AmtB